MRLFLPIVLLCFSIISCGLSQPEQQSQDLGRVILYEGNDCSENTIGETDDSTPQEINFKERYEFENDETRSVLLINVRSGISIRLFDHPRGDLDDDWVEIQVIGSISEVCVDSYEQSYRDNLLNVTFHEHNGLDGKVSRLEILDDDFVIQEPTKTEEHTDENPSPLRSTITPAPVPTASQDQLQFFDPFIGGQEEFQQTFLDIGHRCDHVVNGLSCELGDIWLEYIKEDDGFTGAEIDLSIPNPDSIG